MIVHFPRRDCPLQVYHVHRSSTTVCATSEPQIRHSDDANSAILTVRLLEARARTGTAELLGLAATVVGDEQGAVVRHQGGLELVLGELVDVLLVVRDDGLGDGLSDGVDL